jgi:phosphoglycerate dehydrogenase-like enzyme
MTVLVDVAPDDATVSAMRADAVEVRFTGPCDVRRRVDRNLLGGTEVLFCMQPPENFEDLDALKWIQLASAGYSQLLPLDLPSRAIRAANAAGVMDVPVSEWNVAMMINLARDMRRLSHNQDGEVWDRAAVFQNEIRGKTVGIWGYGGIGRETARLARSLGMQVYVMAREAVGQRSNSYSVPGTGDPEGVLPHRVFTPKQLPDFLADLDFLVLAIPLAPSTEGIVGEAELRGLPRRSYVLNPARGPLIQEAPLLRALREGWIAGAALDTHHHYPLPTGHPLWHMPNVIVTPHISGSSLGTHYLSRTWDVFRLNLDRYRAGRELLNEISAQRLKGE